MYPQQPYPQPQYPVYPQAPAYAPPTVTQHYPPQPQYPQQPPAAPQQPTAAGSLDQFYNQPGGGTGKAWSFHQKPIGTTYTGIVARAITNGDIQQQTDLNTGAPRFFRDGRPMFVMIVPLLVQPSPEFPEGQASWWVRGQARDELVRAMAEAGAPEGPPEAGAAVAVTLVGQRPSGPGRNPSYVYRVVYRRPDGAPPATQPAPVVEQQPTPAGPGAPPPAHGQHLVSTAMVPPPLAAPPPPPPVQPQPQLAGLNAEQQALLAKLTGAGA